MLKKERILPTKNKRIFEVLLFLDSVSCQSNAQKQPEAGLFLVRIKGGVMAEAAKHLWILSKDETLQELAMVKERDRKDQAAREDDAYEEGMKKGRKDGMKKGIEKGMEKWKKEWKKGWKNGKRNGKMEKGMEVVKGMEKGMTGLSKDDILKLKK